MEYRESTTARRLRNPAGQRPIPFGGGVGRAAPLDETSSGQSSRFISHPRAAARQPEATPTSRHPTVAMPEPVAAGFLRLGCQLATVTAVPRAGRAADAGALWWLFQHQQAPWRSRPARRRAVWQNVPVFNSFLSSPYHPVPQARYLPHVRIHANRNFKSPMPFRKIIPGIFASL